MIWVDKSILPPANAAGEKVPLNYKRWSDTPKPSLKISADLYPAIISKNVPAEAQPDVAVRITMTLSPTAPAPLSFLRKLSLVEPHMDQRESSYQFIRLSTGLPVRNSTFKTRRCPPDNTTYINANTPATYDGIISLLPGVPATFDIKLGFGGVPYQYCEDAFTGTEFYENYESGEAYLLRLCNGSTTPLCFWGSWDEFVAERVPVWRRLLGGWSFREDQKLQDLVDFDISQEQWPILIVEGDKPDGVGPTEFTTHVPW